MQDIDKRETVPCTGGTQMTREAPSNRSHRTERALRTALLELMLEKGAARVTVQEITERAGVDRSTFYLHFRDRQALWEASQRQLMDELLALAAAHTTFPDRILAVFRHMAENPLTYRVLLATADTEVNRYLQEYLAGHLTGRVLEFRRRAGIPPEAAPRVEPIAHYFAGGMRAAAKWWLEEGMPFPPEEMRNVILRLLPPLPDLPDGLRAH